MTTLRTWLRNAAGRTDRQPASRRVLNVGGNDKHIPIPSYYDGWDHELLDIDAALRPDIVWDARELASLPAAAYDAVYCSHNLEHYYKHECRKVLDGFQHVLKIDGFVELHVPDLDAVMRHLVQTGHDLEDVLYQSPAGPITARDVFYGYSREVEESGQDYFAHKTGFTPRSLYRLLRESGFTDVFVSVAVEVFNIRAYAFRRSVTPEQRRLLGLVGDPS